MIPEQCILLLCKDYHKILFSNKQERYVSEIARRLADNLLPHYGSVQMALGA
jgi:hypothetical protein